jgi:hypothetical protein
MKTNFKSSTLLNVFLTGIFIFIFNVIGFAQDEKKAPVSNQQPKNKSVSVTPGYEPAVPVKIEKREKVTGKAVEVIKKAPAANNTAPAKR